MTFNPVPTSPPPVQRAVHALRFLRWFALLLFLGCATEKESLHENDHEDPDHWPADLAEAAAFIDSRMQSLTSDPARSAEARARAIEELRDLIEWTPEIAADTTLSESQWIPIYELSETIRKHMQPGDVDPTVFSSDFEKLIRLLRDADARMRALQTKLLEPTEIGVAGPDGNE